MSGFRGIASKFRAITADRTGAAALEFAIVAIPFVGFLIGLVVVPINLYLQFVLDYSLQESVRQVQLGLLPAAYTAADFTEKVFCPVFSRFVSCQSVIITLQPVADYQSAAVVAVPGTAKLGTSAGFCVGQPGQLMFARVVYLAPTFSEFWPYATQVSSGGTSGTALVSTAAFANENPLGSPIPAGGGC